MVFSCALQADIYKWVDENGDTHYAERKPSTQADVESVTPKASPALAERESWEARNEAFEKQRTEASEAQKKDAEAAADAAATKRNCEQAKIRAAKLEFPRINKVDADGTRTRMPEEWRQTQLNEAKTAIGKYCI